MVKQILYGLVLVILAYACQSIPQEFNSKTAYLEWLKSPDSGLLIERETEKLKLQMLHYPEALNADNSTEDKDRIKLLAFQMRISTKEQEDKILKLGIQNEAELKRRIKKLEFEHAKMFIGIVEDTIQPIFTHYENYRGLKNEILFHVQFELDETKIEDFKITFKDQIFQTGDHDFVFDGYKLKHPPKLILT